MELFDRVIELFKPDQPRPLDADPRDMRIHVRDAYALLCDANKKAVQIPADVIEVLTEARKVDEYQLPSQMEARFWNAYGLLSSSIRPAQRARTFYRNVFYLVLLVLLGSQFFFLSGDYARTKLNELDKKIVEIRGKVATAQPQGTAVPANVTASTNEQIGQIQNEQQAYMRMSGQLLAIVGNVVQLPFAIFGIQNFFLADQVAASATPERITAANLLVRGKLDMLLVFLSGFVLPMLYGLLGACAFVLRQLSDEIDKLTYAHDARVRYSLRLNIGLLSGLAVGWFIKPGSGDATLISLSPLALAFIAGYGSDLFFVALDKVVQAFSPASGAGSKTVKEVVTGGIVTTSTRSEEVHVAGPDKDAAKTQQEDGKGHPVADKRVTEPTAESKSKAA